jgi:hypothetical protein
MPYLNLREPKAKAALSLMQTVQGNMEGFTKRKVKEACEACKAQAMLGHPTNCNFLGMVHGGMISNCPMSANTLTNAHLIFGPDLAGVRGRTVQRPPESVTTDYVQIPQEILQLEQNQFSRLQWTSCLSMECHS